MARPDLLVNAPDLCPTCGAYWDCEHVEDYERHLVESVDQSDTGFLATTVKFDLSTPSDVGNLEWLERRISDSIPPLME